jgi:hypothetical protein
MKTDHDLERAVRLWVGQGSDQLPEPALDAALDRIETTKQRHAGWLARRFNVMNGNALKFGLAAAAMAIVAILGVRYLPGAVGGLSDPTPTPIPTPATLASGSFAVNLGEFGTTFDIDATRAGSDASGTIVVSNPQGGEGTYTVDVQCTRTTDNLLLIGGEVTDSTYELIADGAYVAIMLVPGTPARMLIGVDVLASDEVPAPADSCEAYLETTLSEPGFARAVNLHAVPINGELDLGS